MPQGDRPPISKRNLSLREDRANSGGMAAAVCIVLLSLLLEGCARPPVREPVTLTLLGEWTTKTFNEGRQQELQQFSQETGIKVKLLPSPESAKEKLAFWQELLRSGASGPDVYGIDVIWTRILNEYFIDLKPYFAHEISLQFPAITASYTVDNKLLAVAYRADMGLLFYRTDLLRQYGYHEPPRTWDELEVMAARIQAGERAAGKKEFWGFVWQGGATEALTCNALEWQASEGGGQIIENDKTISVNNPHAIRAWQPPSLQGTIIFPGFDGGSNWGGGSFDPTTGWYYINSHDEPWILTLVPAADGAGYPYTHTGYNHYVDAEGYAAIKPPWGQLTAYNLN